MSLFGSKSDVSNPSFYVHEKQYAPLLNRVESLELGHGHKDDDRLLATLHIDLSCGRDLEGAELSLELGHIGLEVEERLCDSRLDLRGRGLGRVGRAVDLVADRHLGLQAKWVKSVCVRANVMVLTSERGAFHEEPKQTASLRDLARRSFTG